MTSRTSRRRSAASGTSHRRSARPGSGGARSLPGRRRVPALAALRMLARERVLARVHERLDDVDAVGIALGQALLTEPLDGE